MEAGLHEQSAESVGTRAASLGGKLLQDITAAVTAAIADAQASAQQTVNDARQQFEMVELELHRQLAASMDDLEKQRDDARALKNQLVIEHAARARAEASLAAAQATQHQVAAGYVERIRALELELEAAGREASRLASELEAASADRTRLSTILDSIRSAVGAGASEPPAGPSGSPHTDTQHAPSHTDTPQAPPAPAALEVSREMVDERRDPADPLPSNSGRNLKFVARSMAESDVVLRDCATQLLDQVEASYQNDVGSLESPFDVVDRLVTQLRTARELFMMRCGNDETLASEEFDRQMSLLLDTKGATAFGRHLGIAWHEMSQPAERAATSAVA